MSKVAIKIDGVEWGLRISPEIAMQLVEALQGVWVASAKHSDGACFLGDVTQARDVARGVITEMAREIFRSARKSA